MKRLVFALALIAASATPVFADPSGDVTQAMMNLAKAKSFHVTATVQGHTVEADMMPPEKMHVTFGSMEFIKIDNDTYAKMGDSWHKFSIPGMEHITGMVTDAVMHASHPPAEMHVTDLGMKTIAGVSLHGYTVADKDHPSATSTFYVDGGGMISRIEAPDGALVTVSKINAPLTIAAPI